MITYDAYAGSVNSRTATITIGGQAHTLTQTPPPPSTPVIIAPSGSDIGTSTITTRWNSASGASAYLLTIWWMSGGNPTYVLDNQDVGNVLSHQVTGLTPGRTYFYEIRAWNPGGPSTASNTVSATTKNPPMLGGLFINNGAGNTGNRMVTLNHSLIGGGTPTQYRTSQNADFTGASWQTYSSTPGFEVSSGEGVKTVYLQLRNSMDEESGIQEDSIYYAPPQAGSFQFAQSSYSAAETAGTVTLTVSRVGGSDGTVTVDYTTSSGTATTAQDFTGQSGTLTFTQGQTSKTISVALLNDNNYEPDETFTVSLSNPTGGSALGSPITATVAITSEDPPQPGTLQFSTAGYTVQESTAWAALVISRSGGSDGVVTVSFSTANGTAVSGSDYTAVSAQTATLNHGETTKTILVAITNDMIQETDETFSVTLSSPGGGASLGVTTMATLTIAANDQPEPEIALEEPVGINLSDRSSRDFGSVNLGNASAPRTFTIRNLGTAPLSDLTISKAGANSSDFLIDTTGLAPTLPPGASTSFSVMFSPSGSGSRSASLQVTSNDSDENPFDVAIVGVGVVVPEIAVEQQGGINLADGTSTISFGNVGLGGNSPSISFTIRNTGTAILNALTLGKSGVNTSEFLINTSGMAQSLSPGEETSFSLVFAPGDLGPRSATLQIGSNDGDENPFDLALSGTGLAVPDIVVEQPAGTPVVGGSWRFFGGIVVGSFVDMPLTIKNIGSGTLTGVGAAMSGPDASAFSVVGAPAVSIETGGSVVLIVRFTPSSVGDKYATLEIRSNDPDEDPFQVGLSGTGFQPDIAVAQPWATYLIADQSQVAYGNVKVGYPITKTFYVHNIGGVALNNIAVSLASSSSPEFTINTTGLERTLNPGTYTSFSATFAPTEDGASNASLIIDSDDPDENPFTVSLFGTGISPRIRIEQPLNSEINSGYLHNFGTQNVGAQRDVVFNIRNIGGTSLDRVSASLGYSFEDYTVVSAPPASILPGESASFTVRFAPASGGTHNGRLYINSDDPDTSLFEIALTGVGASPGGSLDPLFNASAVFAEGTFRRIYTIIPTYDGKYYMGGSFTSIGQPARFGMARLKSDGYLETFFYAAVNYGDVRCLHELLDGFGQVIVGGSFTAVNGITRNGLAKLDRTGAVDPNFNPNVNNNVLCIAPTADGAMFIGGLFNQVGSQTRNRMAKILTDGSVASGFSPSFDYSVQCITPKNDGSILVGGDFSTVNGQNRSNLAKLNADGVLDTSFTPAISGAVNASVEQPDGKILIAGNLKKVNNLTRNRIARLHPDGTLDSSFDPNVTGGDIQSMVLQHDGKILIGGYFTHVGGVAWPRVARLNAGGSLDLAFNANVAAGVVDSVCLQKDGKVLLGGSFTAVNGSTTGPVARLENGAQNDQLLIHNESTAEWKLSNTAPAFQDVVFEFLPNAPGATFQSLGAGIRIESGWMPTGLDLTVAGRLYATGRLMGGQNSGSGSYRTASAYFSGLSSINAWRKLWFGTTANAGASADSFDFDQDGLVNLVEWACGLNPTTSSILPTHATPAGENVEFTYDRSISAVNAGAVFVVEWSDTLVANDWHTTGVTESEVSSNGTTQQMKSAIPAGTNGRRFVRLKISSPP